ncbi:hypothetical protein [Helicobacter sp. 23-1045]
MEYEEGNKKATLALIAVIATVIILAAVTYFFFYKDTQVYDNAEIEALPQVAQEAIEAKNEEQILPDSAIDSANAGFGAESADFAVDSAISADSIKTSIASLKYSIKPNDVDIFACVNFRNGGWTMPKSCKGEVISAVQRLIDNNAELIAIEVSGIVDNNPYAGPSAELKQEGLASFRAREGIITIMNAFSNVAAFEGPSMQLSNQRGFQVKAYYLQK